MNPCDDFYHFACGSFVKNTYIPDEKVTVDSFSIVRDKLQEQTQTIISEDSLPGESKPFTLAKNLYQSCLNKSIIAERGLQPLNDLIKKYGGWPVVEGDNWNDAGWDWKNLIKRFRDDGMEDDPIFTFTVGTNLTNSSARTIDVSLLGTMVKIILDETFLCSFLIDRSNRSWPEQRVHHSRSRRQSGEVLLRLHGRHGRDPWS